MKSISRCIAEGAGAFLKQEFKYMLVYIVCFAIILGVFVSVRKSFSRRDRGALRLSSRISMSFGSALRGKEKTSG